MRDPLHTHTLDTHTDAHTLRRMDGTTMATGRMFTLGDILGDPNVAGQDGTYVAVQSAIYGVRLMRVTETDGFEVAYDTIAPEAYPTTGGAQAYLRVGDRIGVWSHDGTTYVDHTVHVRGPRDIAWIVGRECAQRAIWDWAQGLAVDELGGIVL